MKVHIIGGGIIGLSAAYHLSNHCDVVVYEKDNSYNLSSFARSCGGFRSQFFTPINVDMSRYSINFIKNKTDVDFIDNGYLMLFGNNQQWDHDRSIETQNTHGATTISLTPEQIKQSFPQLYVDDLYRGCITTDESEAWLDPVTLHNWFKKKAQQPGVEIIYKDGLEVDHSIADYIVIVCGCWTNEVAKHFNINVSVKGHKHTVFNVSTQIEQIRNLPLVADLVTGVYLRPEGEGYIVGYDGNGEWSSDNLDPNYNSWNEVWEHLYHRFPTVFDAAKMEGAWAGYYDTSTIDNNAIIDSVNNIYFATGFTGRGLMHSPAIGLTLTQMILKEKITFNIEALKLNRNPNFEKYVI
jgi:glycine/D-amino acid oxidase-like deaminating enzyme